MSSPHPVAIGLASLAAFAASCAREPVPVRSLPPARLAVSVFDHLGQAVDLRAPYERPRWGSPRLEVERLVRGRVSWDGEGFRHTFRNDRLFLLVEAGHEYLVTWEDVPHGRVEETVEIRSDDRLVPVEIHLPAPREEGTLHVVLNAPEGTPERELPWPLLLSPKAGHLVGLGVALDENEPGRIRSLRVPAGSYRFEADVVPRQHYIGEELGMICGNEPLIWYLPRFTSRIGDVEVLPGEEVTVGLELEPAGFLAFEGRAPRSGEVAVLRGSKRPSGYDLEQARSELGGGWVGLHRADGSAVPGFRACFEAPELDVEDYRYRIDWTVPGWSAKCLSPLPVGDWSLRVTGDDGVLLERDVHVAAGETTSVRW